MLYIANWKMYLSFDEQVNFVANNKKFLNDNKIIICPTYLAIDRIKHDFEIEMIGAQNCSEYSSGAYTSEISAKSLSEIGCQFCIVGHSEQRKKGETNEQIAKKIRLLFENNIIPIICIGESESEYNSKRTNQVLNNQIEPFLDIIEDKNFIIAYEPIWAIGSGKTPINTEIKEVFDFLKLIFSKKQIQEAQFHLIYGGSVSDTNVKILKKIENLDGFLIGKASTDFQELKKIVEYK